MNLNQLSAQTRRNLLVLFIAGLLFWSSIASLLPTLPLYIADIGGDSQTIGIVLGCFAIGLLGTRSWLARLADFRGRKLVLLIGILAAAIAPLGYLLTQSIPLLVLVRAFHGISIAAFALAYSALVVDFSLPQHRGELIGYMSLVNPIGMGLGPALGGYLLERFESYPIAFLASAGAGGLGWLFTMAVREAPHTAAPDFKLAVEASPPPFWGMLLHPSIRVPALVLLMIGISFGALSTFVPLLVKESGVRLNVGLFYLAAAIASFSIRLLVGRASDRFGRGPFITLSLVLYTMSMVALWQATSAPAFLLAGALEGAGAGVLIPMMAALMADRSQPHERGRTFSLCMVGFDVGIALAGPVLGSIALYFNYRSIFGLSALMSFVSILFFLTLSNPDLPHSLRFALGRGSDVYAEQLKILPGAERRR